MLIASLRPAHLDRNHHFARNGLLNGNLPLELAVRIGGTNIGSAVMAQIATASSIWKDLAPIIQPKIRASANTSIPGLVL